MADYGPLIVFSHGKEGTPDGSKIKALMAVARKRGCDVDSIDYRQIVNPDDRAKKLYARVADLQQPLILVGSSMGAYISITVSEQVSPLGLFLLAPALYLNGYQNQDPTPKADLTTIVHGWHDEVVPVANVMAFAEKHLLRLHLVDADHRLKAALPFMEGVFDLFLDELLGDA